MSESPERISISTNSPSESILDALSYLIPGAIQDGVIDVQRLAELAGLEVSGVKNSSERFGLMWAGKSKAVEALQAPSMAALVPDLDNSINWDTAENVFIEGDNLEVLKLLQKAYNDQVKLIYIDPPYNTGNDFVYNDDFSEPLKHYLEVTGQVDSDGNRLVANTEVSGRKHSNWLSMMYPRLVLARNLLRDDGAIVVSIGEDEISKLGLLMDEIFGEQNRLCTLVWKNKSGGANDSKHAAQDHEYLLVYARNLEKLVSGFLPYNQENLSLYSQSDEFIEERGPYRRMLLSQKGLTFSESLTYEIEVPDGTRVTPEPGTGAIWRWSQDTLERRIQDGFVEFIQGQNGDWKIYTKQYLKVDYDGNPIERGSLLRSVIDKPDGRHGTRELTDLLGPQVFTNPKPVGLLRTLIQVFAPGDRDVIFDFFAGSGTTAQAVFEQNASDGAMRRFVLVNLPEMIAGKLASRKAEFTYVSEITRARIHQVASQREDWLACGLRCFKLGKSVFMSHVSTDTPVLFPSTLDLKATNEEIASEILLKNGVRLDFPWTWTIVDGSDIAICDGVTAVLARELTNEICSSMLDLEGVHTVVFLEDAFAGRDAVKANAYFAFKQANKTMKTI